ncbi:MAG: hypothetical protein HY257_11490 [Chloroflexi bacterium]|nr:hypothetical protein [Chloroflexota bacterium]
MDPAQMAQAVTTFLAPFLPYLVKGGLAAGKSAAKELGKKFGADAWEYAEKLWESIHPKFADKPAAQEAVEEFANNPEDADAQAALRLQLRKIFQEDQVLAQDVSALIEQAKAAGVNVIVSGERNIVARDVTNTTMITGDNNTVKR